MNSAESVSQPPSAAAVGSAAPRRLSAYHRCRLRTRFIESDGTDRVVRCRHCPRLLVARGPSQTARGGNPSKDERTAEKHRGQGVSRLARETPWEKVGYADRETHEARESGEPSEHGTGEKRLGFIYHHCSSSAERLSSRLRAPPL